MSHNGLGDSVCRGFDQSLRLNRTLTHLDLSHNRIGLDGVVSVLRPLGRLNENLAWVNLSHSQTLQQIASSDSIAPEFFDDLLSILVHNNGALQYIAFNGCWLPLIDLRGDEKDGTSTWGKTREVVNSIDLSGPHHDSSGEVCYLDVFDACVIFGLIAENKSLQHLDISNNRIGDRGCFLAAQMLRKNVHLRSLVLDNRLGPQEKVEGRWYYGGHSEICMNLGHSSACRAMPKQSRPAPDNQCGNAIGQAGSGHLADALVACVTLRMLNGISVMADEKQDALQPMLDLSGRRRRNGEVGHTQFLQHMNDNYEIHFLARQLSMCDGLRQLKLASCNLSTDDIEELCLALALNRSLEALDISDNAANGEIATSLSRNLCRHPRLCELDIRGVRFNQVQTDELTRWLNGGLIGKGKQDMSRSFVRIKCLNHLDTRIGVTSRGSSVDLYEAHFLGHRILSLESLDVGVTGLDEESFAPLAWGLRNEAVPRLSSCHFDGNALTNAALDKALDQLARSQHLTTLDVSSNAMTCSKSLCSVLKGCHGLKEVYIHSNPYDKNAAARLEDILSKAAEQCPKLLKLNAVGRERADWWRQQDILDFTSYHPAGAGVENWKALNALLPSLRRDTRETGTLTLSGQNKWAQETETQCDTLQPYEVAFMVSQINQPTIAVSTLKLNDCQLGKQGLIILARGLKAECSVKCIELRGNALSDDAVPIVCELLQHCGFIQQLDIRDNSISTTDDVEDALCCLSIQRLEVLNGLSILGVSSEFRPSARSLVVHNRTLRRYEASFIGWQLAQPRANTEMLKLSSCDLDDESFSLITRGLCHQSQNKVFLRLDKLIVVGSNCLQDRSIISVQKMLDDAFVKDNLRLSQLTVEFQHLSLQQELALDRTATDAAASGVLVGQVRFGMQGSSTSTFDKPSTFDLI